ncbi:MAG: hypothetical protein ACXADC_12515 [Candidatus Thorarchaeota archaeon]|jgi:hypothetical protein
MATSFNTIAGDLKTSAKLASGNMLSYFLANLGMMIIVALLLGIVAIPLVAITIATDGAVWLAIADYFAAYGAANPWALGGMVILLGIPVVALFLTVVGSIYGMSKDLVAHGETKAERAFTWFRHKFLTFAGAGVLLTIIILLPPLVVAGSVSILMGYVVTPPITTLLSVFTFAWVFVTVGLCAMVFPAITHGKGVQAAFKESFRLARERFDHVYGLLSAVVVLLAASYGPVIIMGLYAPGLFSISTLLNPIVVAVMIWTIVVTFLWLLVLLPMTIIAFTKVYAEMTGGQVATQKPPQLPLF